ncbi:MAG: hypothetical protein KF764_19755 [Labilithrix sp.]|nr:hypothetical protein [Labilithrix sp.]MBX3222850.1 hypothetical protein [Labilithrix sp.]
MSSFKLWPALAGLAAAVSATSLSAATLTACGDDGAPPEVEGEDAALDTGAEPPPPPPASEGGSANTPPKIEVDCPVGTAVEIEDNGTTATANELDGELSFCGAISPGSDVDYSTFTTPAGKKLELFQGVIEGAVDFDLIVNGKTLRPGEVKKFEAGKYLIKAYTTDQKPGKYRYRIQFAP